MASSLRRVATAPINAVAQATLGSGCAFRVLSQGTFNYFSRTHGIPADTVQGMQVLLRETAQPVQVGLVNNRVFLVNASLGLYPKLLEDRETWKKQLGRSRWVAFGAALNTLLRGFRNLHLEIEVLGETREVRTLTLFVGNNALQMEQVGIPEAQAIDAGALAGMTLRPVAPLTMLGLSEHRWSMHLSGLLMNCTPTCYCCHRIAKTYCTATRRQCGAGRAPAPT